MMKFSSKEAYSALLNEPDQDVCSSSDVDDIPKVSKRPSALHHRVRQLLLHLVFLSLHLLLFAVLVSKVVPSFASIGRPWLIHSPANTAISYVAKQFHTEPSVNSVYVGEPRAEVDEAWQSLLNNTNIRISQADMDALDRKDGIALPDGGYIAIVNVYHELHCIKRLYQYMYPDHYFPNLTKKELIMNRMHNEHCLDTLRQGIMCRADTQLLTLRWESWSRVPTANFSAPHQCVDWDRLDRWAGDRRVNRIFEEGYLMHPTLGPAFPPNAESKHLGVAVIPEGET